MSYMEQLEKNRQEAMEEGRRQGAEETTRHFVEALFKDSGFPLEKIALLAEIPLDRVKEIGVSSVIEDLAKIKRRKVVKEMRASSYCEDYIFRSAENYISAYKEGLRDGSELVGRRFAEKLPKVAE